MTTRYIHSNHLFINNTFIEGVLELNNGIIKNIHPSSFQHNNLETVGDYYVLPGLIDVHTHGYSGWSFTATSKVKDLLLLSKKMASLGVTSMLCSAAVSGYDNIIETITEHQDELATKFLGIHAEGPFLTVLGAAKPDTVFPDPDVSIAKKMVDKAKGYLKYTTIAIEKNNAEEVIDFYIKNNIKVAIGHTEATAHEFNALKDKCQAVTHTGNAMRGIHHRDIGALGAALLDKDIYCEIIADGLHLSDDMLQLIFEIKPHEKLVLVSDTTALAGLVSKTYELSDYSLEVNKEGLVVNEFGHISGSSRCVLECVRHLCTDLKFRLENIIPMATIQPARILGIEQQKGKIAKGFDADLVVLDQNLLVVETISEGKTVYVKGENIISQNPDLDSIIKNPEFMNFYQ